MDELQANCWYWIRRDDGTLAPYRFHRMHDQSELVGEFYVGSALQLWPLSRVVGEAQMPKREG